MEDEQRKVTDVSAGFQQQNRRAFMKRGAALGAGLCCTGPGSQMNSESERLLTGAGRQAFPTTDSQPFIRTREVTLTPSHRGDAQLNFEHWDMERIKRYIEMLKAFGFNSLELMEVRGYVGGYQAAGFPRLEDLQDKINAIADLARSLGMRTSIFLWAQILFEQAKVHCPSDPEERSVIEREHERFARVYAPHFDHFVAYWGEPGPCMKSCGKCDYSTYQAMTTSLLDRFRQYNSKARASFSVWGLLIPERAGRIAEKTGEILGVKEPRFLERMVAYKGVIERLKAEGPIVDDRKRLAAMDRLARADALSKDIAICLDGCTIGALTWSGPTPLYFDEIDVIAKAGRPVGVWGWYLVDLEGTERSDFEIQRISDFFESFPSWVGGILDWHSVDITSHGWPPVIVNAYVAAQKMISPGRHPDDILSEFCAAQVGRACAPALAEAFLTLDKAPLVVRVLPKVDALNLLGTPDYEEMASQGLKRLRACRLDPGFKPAFPTIVDPAGLKQFATDRLEHTLLVSRYLREFRRP